MTRVLGIDYGTRRTGLALSDGLGIAARALDVVPTPDLEDRLRVIADEYDIGLVVIGLPVALSGGEGVSAEAARDLGERVGRWLGVEVIYMDERFTSRMAESLLLESGMKRRERRDTRDKVAAAIILQSYLDSVGGNPGEDRGVQHPDAR